MRLRVLIATSVALAAFGAGAGVRAAPAGETMVSPGGQVSLTAHTSKSQGAAYGVRARAPDQLPDGDSVSALPVIPLSSGQGLADFDSMAVSSAFQTIMPFAAGIRTQFGPITMSGYRVTTTTPRLLSGIYLGQDRVRHDLRDFEFSAAVAPGVTLDLGYNLDLGGRFNRYDAFGSGAYDGLFYSASAVNSPYVGLTDGGDFIGATIRLSEDLHLRLGASSLHRRNRAFMDPLYAAVPQAGNPQNYFDQRTAQSAEAAVNWDFAKWGGLGVTASSTTEHNGILGRMGSDALVAKTAKTTAVGLSARFGFGKGWVTTFSYNQGTTQLNLRPNSLVHGTDSLQSHAFGVAVAKHGLFSDTDSLGVALTRPMQVYKGGADLAPAMEVGANGNLVVGHGHPSLLGKTPETDVELGYVTTFFDGALALQANAGYQMNFAGQHGTNALTVLSRAKFNF